MQRIDIVTNLIARLLKSIPIFSDIDDDSFVVARNQRVVASPAEMTFAAAIQPIRFVRLGCRFCPVIAGRWAYIHFIRG